MNVVFQGVGIEELLLIRERLRNRLMNGSQTRVAMAQGMADEFGEKSDEQLRRLLAEVNEALNELDPTNYPMVTRRMRICTVHEM